jgi:hypothetical protein
LLLETKHSANLATARTEVSLVGTTPVMRTMLRVRLRVAIRPRKGRPKMMCLRMMIVTQKIKTPTKVRTVITIAILRFRTKTVIPLERRAQILRVPKKIKNLKILEKAMKEIQRIHQQIMVILGSQNHPQGRVIPKILYAATKTTMVNPKLELRGANGINRKTLLVEALAILTRKEEHAFLVFRKR